MSNERSSDEERKTFNHDENRGKWSRPSDFIFACAGHSFRSETILLLYGVFGFYALILYFLFLAVCIIPILFIQSFLGQFSGTGFISAFRVVPLFKGIGYVSLFLNFISLVYYTVFTAMPLTLFTDTLLPSVPWNCDEARDWVTRRNYTISPCGVNGTFDEMSFVLQVPSVTFFYVSDDLRKSDQKTGFFWIMFLWSGLVSLFVVLIAMSPIQTIGTFLRFSYITMIGLMSVLLVRFFLLPGAVNGLWWLIRPFFELRFATWPVVLTIAMSTLGPGWGSTISLASFNDFKTNIYSFSWILSCVQFSVIFGVTLLSALMSGFLFSPTGKDARRYFLGKYKSDFHLIPTGLSLIEVPRFWLMLFFGMIFLGSLNLLVAQLVAIQTSLFDEFEDLRVRKKKVLLALGGLLIFCFLFLCSDDGLRLLSSFMEFVFVMQIFLNLLLLVVVLCLYRRFQRDVLFMTGQVYSNFMLHLNRFLTPVIVILSSVKGEGIILIVVYLHLVALAYGLFEFVFRLFPSSTNYASVLVGALALIPVFLITCCFVIKCMQSILVFKNHLRPSGWYPADPAYRQRYEETFLSNSVISLQVITPDGTTVAV